VVALLALDPRGAGSAAISGGLALAALAVLVAAIVLAAPSWIGPALGFLATLFVVHLVLVPSTGLVAAGFAGIALLAAGELAQWSIEARHRGRYDGPVHVARARGIAVLLLRGTAVVLLGGIAAAVPLSGGLELVIVGTAAAVALFGLTAFAGSRAR
jgi:hypothetical protein